MIRRNPPTRAPSRTLRTLCVLISFLGGISLSAAGADGDRETVELLDRINRLRRREGLTELPRSGPAAEAADKYAGELARGAPFSHIDPEGNAADRRYRAAGGTGLHTGEVLGKGPDQDSIISLWLESPEHREVIFGAEWTGAGGGIAVEYARDDDQGIVYAAMTFVNSLYAELKLTLPDEDPPPGKSPGRGTFERPGSGVPVLTGRYLGKDPPVVTTRGRTMIPRIDTAGRFSLPLPGGGTIFAIRLGSVDPDSGRITLTDMAVFDSEGER